jgi:hypothetical protein
MIAQPNFGERGWNGPMKYGASMGRPSRGLTEHFTAEKAIEEAKRIRESILTLEQCLRHRMVETNTRTDPEIRKRYAEAYRLETMAATGKLADVKVSLRRIRLNNGGYDSGGAYWGLGGPLYWAGSDCGTVDLWFRAGDRNAAKAHVRDTFPNATFYL